MSTVSVTSDLVLEELKKNNCDILANACFNDSKEFTNFVDFEIERSIQLLYIRKQLNKKKSLKELRTCLHKIMDENITVFDFDEGEETRWYKQHEKQLHYALREFSISKKKAMSSVILKKAYEEAMYHLFDIKEQMTDQEYMDIMEYNKNRMVSLTCNIKMYIVYHIQSSVFTQINSFSKPLHPQSCSMGVGDNLESYFPQP